MPLDLVASSPQPRHGLYRSLWHYAAGARLTLVGAAALLAASQLLRLAVPWFAGQAIDALQVASADFVWRSLGWIAALFATCVATWGLHGPGRVLERAVGVRVRRAVTEQLFEKLANAPLKWHDRHAGSDLAQRVTQASGALDEFAQSQYLVLQGVLTFVGTLTALVFFAPATGAVAVTAYAVLVVVGLRVDRARMRLAQEQNDAERRFGSGALAFIGGIVTVTALRLAPTVRRMLGARLEAVFVPLSRSIRLNEIKWCVVDLTTTAITWGVVALYIWRVHGTGATILVGGVFVIHRYAEQAGGVVTSAASHFQSFAHYRVNFASADLILDAPTRVDATTAIDPGWSSLALHQVCFAHASATGDEAQALDHVSLALRRGERVALVGASGSGKSTLMRVMAGLYDASHGHLSVDGIAYLGLKPLARASTFVPQDADVFEGTVLDNVTMGDEASPAALQVALEASAFDDVLATLPDGLATHVAERGASLSGGQRQRLALARGFLAATDSSLVFLDEPTSALDPLTEARIVRGLDAAFPRATIVASVHRMNLLEHFDRVVLMDAGRIVDTGGVTELAARQPTFAAMLDDAGASMVELEAA